MLLEILGNKIEVTSGKIIGKRLLPDSNDFVAIKYKGTIIRAKEIYITKETTIFPDEEIHFMTGDIYAGWYRDYRKWYCEIGIFLGIPIIKYWNDKDVEVFIDVSDINPMAEKRKVIAEIAVIARAVGARIMPI